MALSKDQIRDSKIESLAICEKCVRDDFSDSYYIDDKWDEFNANYCITECDNSYVPKYLPKEQVIKYLKIHIKPKGKTIKGLYNEM